VEDFDSQLGIFVNKMYDLVFVSYAHVTSLVR